MKVSDKNERRYRSLMNGCLLIALSATFIPRISVELDWLAGTVAIGSALVAVGAFFLSLNRGKSLPLASSADSEIASSVTDANVTPVSAELAPSWEFTEDRKRGWLVGRFDKEKYVSWKESHSDVLMRKKWLAHERLPETERLQRLSQALLPEGERTVVVTIGKITIRIDGDDAQVHVATVGKPTTESDILPESSREMEVPIATPRVVN